MRKRVVASVVIVAVAAGAAVVAREQGQIGGTTGRLVVQNRGRAEAIPVSLQEITFGPNAQTSAVPVHLIAPVALAADASVRLAQDTVVRLAPGAAVAAARQTWEYRELRLTGGAMGTLNSLGADGWELVAAFSQPGGDPVALFKRPVR